MRKILSLTLVFLVAAAITPTLLAQQPSDIDARSARVSRAVAGSSLTAPSQAAPTAIVHEFLNFQKRTSSSLGDLQVTRENRLAKSGLTHVRIEQEIAGLQVFGTYAKAALNGQGELVHLIENLAGAPLTGVQPALVGPGEALSAALARVHPGYKAAMVESDSWGNTVAYAKGTRFFRDPTVTRVAIPMRDGSMHEGYLVETWTGADNLLHHTLVGRSGRVLGVQLRTNTDSYNIFPDHPGNSSQTVTAGAGNGNAESPNGWLSGNQTTVSISGNNVHAYLDTDANNSPDGGGSAVTDGNFLTSANLNQEPETAQNQAVAVQNLFYFNNVIHDKLYSHGFTESAGNFQADDNDEVLAEAQDGSGTNNANFSTPNDGSNGRMQMFVWTQTSPKRDGDVDSDIIWHEYGHGLTWRMIGNMSGAMSGAIGEGMSDVLAILINDDDVVGEYSTNDSNGIRSAPYTNYGRTYGDFGGNSVHFDGEIYAATIWRLWEKFQANSISQDTLFDHLVGGMNFTPSGPAMEDMRDGILQQASGSGDECLIWEAFAEFGIGVGAEATVKGGGPFGGNVSVTESFALPAECGGGGPVCSDPGESCSTDSDCCSNNCSGGKPSTRVCLQ